MKISTKGRYGVRVMLELAIQQGKGPIMMGSVAEKQGISRKYLHSLLTSLKAAGLVRSIRGAGGGYVLAKIPSQIRVADIVLALEGPLAPVDCVNDKGLCERADLCVVREVWQKLASTIEDVLSGITIEDLLKRFNSMQGQMLMYHI